ncbi:MAG: AAA family ATPase [Pseudanabaenaceae cyanobacterium bins.68]|nr:AAA family ATPase [Pseudanabaenaceae cyanobacterium bins.68]
MTYYISPRFLDHLAVHITKNLLNLPGIETPLILGIHGRKGEGKTFQSKLAFERLGIEPVQISGSELESPDAGDPARLVKLRYREAAELMRVRGRICVLVIHDLDAGVGRLDASTQYTVNTQLVNATLMNIADHPTNVQLPGSYDERPIKRVPIIVTGNDFSTLYAPLVRDGRMTKFWWQPDHSDRVGIVAGIFTELSGYEVEQLVQMYGEQSIDFFGALRSRLYDQQIREFIARVGLERLSTTLVNSDRPLPQFYPPQFSLQLLKQQGDLLLEEQQQLAKKRLSTEYL